MAARGRTTRRRDTEPAIRTTGKGLVVLAILAGVVYLAVSAYNGVPFRSYRTMYADVPQVGNLIQHDQIRIAGVRVGQVLGTTVGRNGQARLRLQLEPGTQLPADTTIAVRANGLLGARYVQLIPGHSSGRLADGALIHGTPASLTPGVTDALDAFDAQTRGALGDMVGALGIGLLGQGTAINDAIRLNAPEQPRFVQMIDTVLARDGAADRLVPSLSAGVHALDSAGPALANGFRITADALTPFADRRSDVSSTLDVSPSTLQAATTGLEHGRQLLAATRSLARAASLTLPTAPRGLRAAAALLRDSHTPLARAASLLREVPPVVPAALKLTKALRPVLSPLERGVSDLIPMLLQIGPYGCNVANLGAVFRSMTGFGGTGQGPGGPAMQFRLQSIPSQETLAIDTGGPSLVTRDGYPAPCKYLATTYPLAVGLP
jgi:phospholipid/cholesterol/gamma-HCH transport system substrate-binding protein